MLGYYFFHIFLSTATKLNGLFFPIFSFPLFINMRVTSPSFQFGGTIVESVNVRRGWLGIVSKTLGCWSSDRTDLLNISPTKRLMYRVNNDHILRSIDLWGINPYQLINNCPRQDTKKIPVMHMWETRWNSPVPRKQIYHILRLNKSIQWLSI